MRERAVNTDITQTPCTGSVARYVTGADWVPEPLCPPQMRDLEKEKRNVRFKEIAVAERAWQNLLSAARLVQR